MDIQELIFSIKQVLKDFTVGTLTTGQVNDSYGDLLKIYTKLENSLGNKYGDGILRGICYYHNIENFTLMTGIYRFDRDAVYPSAYYGDQVSHKMICSLNPAVTASIIPSKIFTIQPEEIPGFKHSIHLYPLISEDTNIYMLAAVTSSRFFSQERFIMIAEMLSFLFTETLMETQPRILSFHEKIKKDIDAYIQTELKRNRTVQVKYFTFELAEKIFNHLGINALLEIPDEIIKNLKNKLSHEHKIFHLSLWEFVSISVTSDSIKPDKPLKKIEFQFRNITLPYQSFTLDVDSSDSLNKMWDHIRKEHYRYITGEAPV